MTLIILHYVFQSESCWVPETLLHTAVSKDIEILVSPQVAGGLAGARGGQEQAQDGVWARCRAPLHRPTLSAQAISFPWKSHQSSACANY